MGRSILAVVAGLAGIFLIVMLATVVVAGLLLPPPPGGGLPDPTGPYLAVNVTYSFLAAICGGYIAGRLAGQRPVMHAAVLAAVLTIMSLISAWSGGETTSNGQPGWYSPVIAVIGVAGVMLGGWLRRRQLMDPIVS